jgi:L-threonylcarbamoyladenylate synthase
MLTRLLSLNPECLEPEKYGRIIRALAEGGVMVYPTDTFYGLGADCFSAPAVRRIYELKQRDPRKPLLVVISDVDMAGLVAVDIPPVFQELASEFWPGPLTLVLRAAESLPRELLGGGESIALRLPDLPWLRALIRQAGFPLVATSANISGEKEISGPEDAFDSFQGKVDIIVDGGRTEGVKPSTVLDLTAGRPRLVREGALSRTKLEKYL